MSKLNILFKLPSRSRPERFFAAIDSIVNNLYDKDNYQISCTIDENDLSMNNPQVIDKIMSIKNAAIEWGHSVSKVNAINRNMPDKWDIVVVSSDDIFFNLFGFDEIIRKEFIANFPNGDGYLHFNEKDTGDILNVMTVCDKKYFDRFGYIYHNEYLSLFADNHQMDVAKILGRYIYIPYSIMEHKNPAYGYMERDELFNQQQKIGWDLDSKKYEEMKARNYDLHLMKTNE